MSNIVCQVESQPDCIAFTWLQGKDSFAPYRLCGDIARNFADLARELRVSLADVVTSYLEVARTTEQAEVVQEHRRACLALAQAGYKLCKRIFNPGKADKSEGLTAGEVSKWLKKLQQLNDSTRLEIVHKGTQPLTVPWNLVYDSSPDEQAFLSGRESPAHWRPFWGIRYDLSGGKQVDPLRRMPWWSKKPRVWMVMDHDTVQGLPEDQRHALEDFRQRHGPVWIESAGELKKQLASGRPDLMYWLCHADPNALYLDGEPIRPRQLLELLENDDAEDSDERTAGLVFLNACQTAESGEAGSFAETFHSLGMCGLIATEHQTIDTFASPFGLDFLDAFLNRGEAIGPVLQRLRGRVPLGLLYAAYCPPDIRVLPPEGNAEGSIAIKVDAPRAGIALGPGPTTAAPPSPLPDKPYCSLQFYDRADRALFVGRDGDILRFAQLLDDSATRLLVLHGESGVGKSSFLRAGVLPYLEEECVGYHFLRDHSKDEVLFVRATNDLTCQLADAIHRFCAKPFSARTPEGEAATTDLPGLLRRVVGKETDTFVLRTALCDDPSLLSRLLAALSEALPFTVLLVIDQGEEVFTLARNESDVANRRIALQILREAVASSGDFKLIVSLRTEYYGRFVDRMRRGAKDSKGVREYLLTDFDEATLAEAVRRPTLKTPIAHANEAPFEKYNFAYADGIPEALAREVITYTTNRQDSALPLLQVICTQLYERAVQSPDHVICLEDLEALGGLKGGTRRHVYSLVARLFPFRKDREAFRRLLTGLYLRQPDGALTTALMPANELAHQWKGRMPFEQMLQAAAASEWRLLRVTSMRLGGEEERRYVSLGHDALAQVATEWDDEFKRGARFRKRLGLATAIVLVLALVGGVVARLREERLERDLEHAQQETVRVRREAELGRAVTDDLGRLDRAREQRKWEEAEKVLERIDGRLAQGGGDEWRERIERAREDLMRVHKDQQMVSKLEEARLSMAAVGQDDFDLKGSCRLYEDAFAWYGLDVLHGPLEEVAAILGTSLICEELVTALDTLCEAAPQEARRLLAIANHADVKAWRRQFREAFLRKENKLISSLADGIKVAELSPGDIIFVAQVLQNANRQERALTLLQAGRQRYAQDFWLNFRLAFALNNASPRQISEVVRYYTAAQSLSPENAVILNNLGVALHDQGKLVDAEAAQRKAIRLRPDFVPPHSNLGIVLRKQGKLPEAVAACREAIRLKPDYSLAYTNLGNALQQQGKLPEAVEAHREAIRLKPGSALAHSGLGNALQQQGKLPQAVAAFRKAICLKPDYAEAHTNLGIVLQQQGKLVEAEDAQRNAIRLKPDLAEAHYHLGIVLRKQGKLPEALTASREAIRLKPDYAEAHCNLGNALRQQGKLAEAEDAQRNAIRLKPDYAEAHCNLGAVLDAQGKSMAAEAAQREAIRLKPDLAQAHTDLGIILRKQGKVLEAVAASRRAIRLKPEFPEFHFNLGNALQQQGNLPEAVAAYSEAIRLKPDYAEAHCNLGAVLDAQGKSTAAEAAQREAIRLKPDLAQAHTNLGIILRKRGNLPEAVAAHREAIRLKPNDPLPYCTLGITLQKQGQFEASLNAFRRGHQLGSKLPGWRSPSSRWVQQAERLVELDHRLPDILDRKAKPRDPVEQAEFAQLCALKRRYAAAASLFEGVFQADASLANDTVKGYRYNAACYAALAAAGKDEEAKSLDESKRTRLRTQALNWLRDDLADWSKRLDSGKPEDRALVEGKMHHRLEDADLAGVRDADALARLPETERADWRKLWQDVDALLKRAGGGK